MEFDGEEGVEVEVVWWVDSEEVVEVEGGVGGDEGDVTWVKHEHSCPSQG